jgi:hypothetical protein
MEGQAPCRHGRRPAQAWPEDDPVEGSQTWFRRVLLMLEPWDEQRLEIDGVHTTGDLV